MMRLLRALFTLAGLVVILGNSPTAAGGKGGKTAGKNGSQTLEAIIVTVDPKKHEISVTIEEKGANTDKASKEKAGKEKAGKEKAGKEKGHEQHYKLTEDVRIFDGGGKVTTLEVFKKGDKVKIVEVEGKIHELHKGATGKK
jgi:hypothetical protein